MLDVSEKVLLVQRDFGDRTNRKHARLKYTIDDRSVAWFLRTLNEYLGYDLEPEREFKFDDNGDRFGWVEDHLGDFHLNLFIEGGRVRDQARVGLRKIAEIHQGDFRLTGNQNLIIAKVSPKARPAIEALLDKYGLLKSHLQSALRLNSISCVALPTCGLALAEAERGLPGVITDLEEVLEGDRTNRKHARLKYTIDDRSVAWFLRTLNEYLGYDLEPEREFKFDDNGDRFGWVEDHLGDFHLNLFIEGGRVRDQARVGLRKIAEIHQGDFRLTGNQNLIIAKVSPKARPAIEALLDKYGLLKSHLQSALRLNSISCVALPTCGLALAEAERGLPGVITDLEEVLEKTGLRHDAITIRMTGCPNGCGRPFLSEIAFVGRSPGKYNVYLGGGHAGDRLNKLYREAVPRNEIKSLLGPLIEDYAKTREGAEKFGDFVIRAGYIAATSNGLDFHANLKVGAFNS